MKIRKFNENIEDYKSKLKVDLMKILDLELYTEKYYDECEISSNGMTCAIDEIISYLEKEGLLNEVVIDSNKYNL